MLHLIVPALERPWPASGAPRPETPVLDRLLARARRGSGPATYAQALFDRFHIPEKARATAPFCWLGLKGAPAPGWVMHADPVHFRPDRDRLLLFTLPRGSLSPDEASEFVRAFNEHFSGQGLELHALTGQQWFVTLGNAPDACFTPLEQAAGQALEEAMPGGTEAGQWRRLLNEVQMLFFQLPVNQAREGQGALAVNGLWFSGPGKCAIPAGMAPQVDAADDDCLLQGLLQGAERQDPSSRLVVLKGVADAFYQQDATAWAEALQEVDGTLKRLLGENRELMLHSCDGVSWHWSAAMRWYFWRRAKPPGGVQNKRR